MFQNPNGPQTVPTSSPKLPPIVPNTFLYCTNMLPKVSQSYAAGFIGEGRQGQARADRAKKFRERQGKQGKGGGRAGKLPKPSETTRKGSGHRRSAFTKPDRQFRSGTVQECNRAELAIAHD